ncbi:aspartyl-phosphate phosphatase Spo0E family protein [Pontibacillus sp. ALD_SL1]|uniref:aspartyl-phosphate phosphatase Spo0E family protein n=1 Tax=Pontibacillus sp. ALD_SL1 TaxID=2777185 RepID=UPI001F6109BC|nr:aspartyl-phosphate phosphatase Spo0E family protein [Pontibacillus sp. ALD_SL1]
MVACLLTKGQLLERIEWLRHRMIVVAEAKGFTCEESLRLSQQLDELLNLYHQQGKSRNHITNQ